MKETIKDETGKVIAYILDDGTYVKASGEVIARVKGDATYTKEGKFVGKGDQGMRLIK